MSFLIHSLFRVVFLADGEIVDEMAAPTADGVLDRMKKLDREHA